MNSNGLIKALGGAVLLTALALAGACSESKTSQRAPTATPATTKGATTKTTTTTIKPAAAVEHLTLAVSGMT